MFDPSPPSLWRTCGNCALVLQWTPCSAQELWQLSSASPATRILLFLCGLFQRDCFKVFGKEQIILDSPESVHALTTRMLHLGPAKKRLFLLDLHKIRTFYYWLVLSSAFLQRRIFLVEKVFEDRVNWLQHRLGRHVVCVRLVPPAKDLTKRCR